MEEQGAQMGEGLLGLVVGGFRGYEQVCQDGFVEVGLNDGSVVVIGDCFDTSNTGIDELER